VGYHNWMNPREKVLDFTRTMGKVVHKDLRTVPERAALARLIEDKMLRWDWNKNAYVVTAEGDRALSHGEVK
jgi:hypothetical protein